MKLSIKGIIGLAVGIGTAVYVIRQDIKASARKHKKVKPKKPSQDIGREDHQAALGEAVMKPWQQELKALMEKEGMGLLSQELEAFSDQFLTIDEMAELREELDDLAVMVGSPFGKLDHDTASVWGGVITVLHLRMRTLYETGENQKYYVDQLHNHASFIPPLAARIGLKRGASYSDTMSMMTKVLECICNQRRNYETEEVEFSDQVPERAIGATS
jgi:hypothetical protein